MKLSTYRRLESVAIIVGTCTLLAAAIMPVVRLLQQATVPARHSAAHYQPLRWQNETVSVPQESAIVGEPQFAAGGSRVLLQLRKERADEFARWQEGLGVVDLSVSPPGRVSAWRSDEAGQTLVFLAEAEGVQSVYRWREDNRTERVWEGRLLGNWRLAAAGDLRQLFLTPMDEHSRFRQTAEKPVSKAGVGLLLVYDPITNRYDERSLNGIGASRNVDSDGTRVTLLSGDGEGILTVRSASLTPTLRPFDVNRDGRSELVTFEPVTDGPPLWRALLLEAPEQSWRTVGELSWRAGAAGGVPVAGDYDGDGVLDAATYLPDFDPSASSRKGNWHVALSSVTADGRVRVRHEFEVYWGHGRMKAVPEDYDGDGRTDIAVFDPSVGYWHLLFSAGEFNRAKAGLEQEGFGARLQWGLPGDTPAPADYDGDGCADLGIVRPHDNGLKWWIHTLPCRGEAGGREWSVVLGAKNDIPVPGDFDGDGAVEPTAYRPSDKRWRGMEGREPTGVLKWGADGALPIAFDFDGDGAADPGLFVPRADFRWLIYNSSVDDALRSVLPGRAPGVTKLRWGSDSVLPADVQLRRHQAVD
ncbi:MAG: VCBS repeat-containing protein [Bdellovibrionales bacterium]|nr:VCBS repeat-containing protein [Bdellovibrionales bacterium]